MKPFTKGLLVGLLLAFSCVGFMASKSNQVGRYQFSMTEYGKSNILDTKNGIVYDYDRTGTPPFIWEPEVLFPEEWVKEQTKNNS